MVRRTKKQWAKAQRRSKSAFVHTIRASVIFLHQSRRPPPRSEDAPVIHDLRLASFPTRFVPTPGLLNGQTARQIAQLSASLKYGKHLSKSTYQRRSPRTRVFSWKIASGGHASEQTRQLTQKSAAPKSLRPSATSGALVSTQASRKFEPNLR